MGRRKNKKKQKKLNQVNNNSPLDYIALPSLNLNPETKKAIFIVLILTLGALSLVSLFGLGGKGGSYLARGLELIFGFGKWIFPVILIIWGLFLYRNEKGYFKGSHYLGLFLFLISLQSLFHIFYSQEKWTSLADAGQGGGHIGAFLVTGFTSFLGFWGGILVLFALFIISLLLIFNTTLSRILGRESLMFKILFPLRWFFSGLINLFYSGQENDYEEDFDPEELPLESDIDLEKGILFSRKKVGDHSEAEEEVAITKKSVASPSASQAKEKRIESSWEPSNIRIDLPLDLLNNRVGKPNSGDVRHNAMIIQRTLENFGIPVEMGEVEVGPTVAQYTLKPSEGVKISRITNLSNDLALALAAHPIRIEAPIPGRALVGIEVPNKTKAIVTLREVLSSSEFKTRENNLMMALGKDVTGKSWIYDITRMPHLLIAGATNSGKSVCINSIIISLLYQSNPDEVRFIMMDPKRVELPIYDGIPHLLTPVITDFNKTINALKWCLNEMNRRFELLAKAKKRNIKSYNDSPNTEKIPYIIFVIDELADLMIAAPREVEAGIIRLTQMSRAVGIHLILATQRPSVDVITGLIKANVPARIAFSVASGVDSKTILDTQGAEKLLGQGDMLFVNPDMSKPKRIQGVFVSDAEVKRVVNYIKEQSGEFDYIDEVTDKQKVEGIGAAGFNGRQGSYGDDGRDDLFEDAKQTIIDSGKASASYLQRKLRVGYARAAGLLDELEEAGIIGPANGSKPRQVLISKEEYQALEDMGVSGVETHQRDNFQTPEDYLAGDNEEKEEDYQEEEEEEEVVVETKNQEDSQKESFLSKLSEVSQEQEEEIESEELKEQNNEADKKDNQEEDEDNGMYFSK